MVDERSPHYSKVSECEGREEGEREAEGEERRGECTNSSHSLTSCPPTETDPSWQSYPRSIELFFYIQSTSEDRLLSSVKHNLKKEGSEKERSFNNKQEAYLIRIGERDVLELEGGVELLRDAPVHIEINRRLTFKELKCFDGSDFALVHLM